MSFAKQFVQVYRAELKILNGQCVAWSQFAHDYFRINDGKTLYYSSLFRTISIWTSRYPRQLETCTDHF